MKYLIILLAFNFSFGQSEETDVNLKTNLKLELSNISKQLLKLIDSHKLLKEKYKTDKKVSSFKNYIDKIEESIKRQKETLSNLNEISNKIIKDRILIKNARILENLHKSIKVYQDFVTNSIFKLNDAERINLIKEEERKGQIDLIRSRILLDEVS